MIKMLILACTLANPDVCEKKSISLTDISLPQCQHYSQLILAMWSNENPNWAIKKYRCADALKSEDL